MWAWRNGAHGKGENVKQGPGAGLETPSSRALHRIGRFPCTCASAQLPGLFLCLCTQLPALASREAERGQGPGSVQPVSMLFPDSTFPLPLALLFFPSPRPVPALLPLRIPLARTQPSTTFTSHRQTHRTQREPEEFAFNRPPFPWTRPGQLRDSVSFVTLAHPNRGVLGEHFRPC